MGQQRLEVTLPAALANVGIVLDRTRHAANIGAVCRVMKNLGFSNLHLVNPTEYGHLAAIRMIRGAEDILENAAISPAFPEAVGGYHIAFAASHRMKRGESLDIAAAAREIAALARGNRVAVVFGSEKFGLTREDLDRCGKVLAIPSNPGFPSINLAQAVAMVCLEVRLCMDGQPGRETAAPIINLPIAERDRFYQELFALFAELGMGAPSVPEKLKDIFDRANLDAREQNLFYGLIKEVRRLKRN
ncbi:MAG: hypothetical protein HZA03_06640 [Nitrospinae bacterium]|nr:hypothetical protein [Nitrospinota bacterium]